MSWRSITHTGVKDWRERLLALVALLAIGAVFFVPRIPQDPAYHLFADTRTIAGVPNFWNVASNIGYLIVGVWGLVQVRRLPSRDFRAAYLVFCIGVICVALGSSYYHYAPSTRALVWDRLPMSVAFPALFSLVLSERVSLRLGRTLLGPLCGLGAASVAYWAWSERQGAGDLRPYGLVQFLPVLLLPLMLLIFPGSRSSARWLWGTIALYVAAKVAEQLDRPLYDTAGFSGHSIKHLLSAVAVLFAIMAMLRLEPSGPGRDERMTDNPIVPNLP
jgi:hypothetical protein